LRVMSSFWGPLQGDDYWYQQIRDFCDPNNELTLKEKYRGEMKSLVIDFISFCKKGEFLIY
ncbi:MAG TPA: hypothetical protein VMW34_04260, partial [Anaerolineales bacterium]|nr:hypothetical protein [Anaerolineales bacterium]